MHDLGTALLQLVDNLHAGEQTFLLALEPVNLGDALLELDNLVRQALVAGLLVGDHLTVREYGQHHDRDRCNECPTQCDAEIALTFLALSLAPGE
jgi:hypothetical protein